MKLLDIRLRRTELTATQEREMFALMDRHYENMNWSTFLADLDEKDWVILVMDTRTNTLSGFTTLALLDVDVEGRPVKVLYSGDTIVAREHWGDRALTRAWGRLALELIDTLSEAEFYWFLISKGYKTYRFLPLFFHEFFPRYDLRTPEWAREVLDSIAFHKFPDTYDAYRGVVRAHAGKDRLRAGVADMTAERLADPHVHFFAQRNPGHARGDELCCIAPLTRANFKPMAYRVIGEEALA